jgi:hypothetical protein
MSEEHVAQRQTGCDFLVSLAVTRSNSGTRMWSLDWKTRDVSWIGKSLSPACCLNKKVTKVLYSPRFPGSEVEVDGSERRSDCVLKMFGFVWISMDRDSHNYLTSLAPILMNILTKRKMAFVNLLYYY